MADTDQMSPDSSPGASSKDRRAPGEQRAFDDWHCGSRALYGPYRNGGRQAFQSSQCGTCSDRARKGGDSSLMAADIVGGRADGLIPEAKAEPPLLPPADPQAPTTPNGVPVARVENPNAPPQPPRGNGGPRSPEDQEDEQLRQRKCSFSKPQLELKRQSPCRI